MKDYHKILLGVLFIAILWSASRPESVANWWLEILPVFVGIPLVIFLGQKFKLSNLSYSLILIYLFLPILQAHYGVAKVPFGFTLSDLLGVTNRNMFDRLTHFAFGLLLTYPLFEIFKGALEKRKRQFLNYFLPAMVIMGFASIYEVVELMVREFSSSKLTFLFVASQADFWDTSWDITSTLIGLSITLLIIGVVAIIKQNYFPKV